MDKIYTAGHNTCWIRVIDWKGSFRASTNNVQAYVQVAKLNFRDNRADAQADLDKLADELHWNEVTDFTHTF